MKPKILVVLRHTLCSEALRTLETVGELSFAPRFVQEDELARHVEDCTGVVLGGNRFSRDTIELAERLRVISRHGVGVDNVDLEAATDRGIVVTYTPGANADSVAEHTFALLLGIIRKVVLAHRSVREGKWGSEEFKGIELAGKTLGIVGFGAIGSRVARRATAFEMNVITHDPYVSQKRASSLGVKLVDLDMLLQSSDVITLHASLTKRTKHLLSKRELGMLKSTAILVNTARGQLVDEEVLTQMLKEGKITGAALDVFENEPLSHDHPFLNLPNVLLTPHIASYTREALSRCDKILARDMAAVIERNRPKYVANPRVLDGAQ